MLGKMGIVGIVILVLGLVAISGTGAASLVLIIPGLVIIGIAILKNRRKGITKPTADPVTPLLSIEPTAPIQAAELPQRVFIPASRTYYSRLRKRFIVVDFETTGLSANQDRIIEIGAVLFENGVEKDTFSCLVKSVNHIPADATAVNHITDDMLRKNGLPEKEAFDRFLNFLGEEVFTGYICLVSHNARFDMAFLQNTLDRLCYVLSGDIRYFDTLTLSRKHLSLSNYKQETVAQFYGIETPTAHRAVTDAQVCGQIMLHLFEQMGIELDTKPIPRSYPPTEQDRLICSHIKQTLQNAGIDTKYLRFEKHSTRRVWVKAPREFCCFVTTGGKLMFSFDRRDYAESSLSTKDEEFSMSGADMVEVEVKELSDLVQLTPSFVAGFRRVSPETATFYSLTEWVKRDTEKSFQIMSEAVL